MKFLATLHRLALFYLVAVVFLVWGVMIGRYQVFPYSLIKPLYSEIVQFVMGNSYDHRNFIERMHIHRQMKENGFPYVGFQLRDKNFVDPGYLLISRFSEKHDQVIIELMRISDQKVLYTWIPPINEILDRGGITDHKHNSESGYSARHPLLLKDGSLIFSSGEGPLVRIDKHSKILWVIPEHFHHSIEQLQDGNLIVPIKYDSPVANFPWMRDDGYAVVTPEGKVLERYSFSDILIRNGYVGLLLGVGEVLKDRIHLNDVQPINRDAGAAKAGDIAMSSRHLSTVLLYRPSTDKIIWLKTGPWLYQHDINLIGDDFYSIFGNDIYYAKINTKIKEQGYGDSSQVYLYNQHTGEVSTPYANVLESMKMRSSWEGRSRILANGDVYIEETSRYRLMRVSKDTVRWVYVNGESLEYTGSVNWSRYLNPDELNLSWME